MQGIPVVRGVILHLYYLEGYSGFNCMPLLVDFDIGSFLRSLRANTINNLY